MTQCNQSVNSKDIVRHSTMLLGLGATCYFGAALLGAGAFAYLASCGAVYAWLARGYISHSQDKKLERLGHVIVPPLAVLAFLFAPDSPILAFQLYPAWGVELQLGLAVLLGACLFLRWALTSDSSKGSGEKIEERNDKKLQRLIQDFSNLLKKKCASGKFLLEETKSFEEYNSYQLIIDPPQENSTKLHFKIKSNDKFYAFDYSYAVHDGQLIIVKPNEENRTDTGDAVVNAVEALFYEKDSQGRSITYCSGLVDQLCGIGLNSQSPSP